MNILYFIIIFIFSIFISCFSHSHPQEPIPLGEPIISPDKMYSFKIEYYDREYHFKVKDLSTGKITSLDFEQGPVLAVKWTSDSKSIFIAAHYARGKLLDVIHYDGKKWKLDELNPPEDNIGEYEVLNWKFHEDKVKLFFKFFLLDEKYHPTSAYKCSLEYDPSTGAISDYKKENISFDAYGKIKSALARDW